MKKWKSVAVMVAVGMLLPQLLFAQGLADQMKGLHGVLDKLYDEMMPMCGQLIGVGRGIAGFAATWYIASRIWRHIANAEPIDFYPLFRPFVLGFCVIIFPSVLGMINGVMKPTVTGTAAMMDQSNKAIETLLKQKEEAIKKSDVWQMYVGESGSGDRDKWYKYTHDNADPSDEGIMESIGNDIRFAMSKTAYSFKNSVKEWMSEVLQVLFAAAALCINTLRTFQLVVLAILGPLVFGIAVFDGFQHTLVAWIAKYINVFLWLPVCNIFGAIIGKVQEKMIELDISQIHDAGDTFFSTTDMAYLVFMIIGIVGYFTVPTVANHIVNAGGGGALVQKVTSIVSGGMSNATSRAADTAGAVAGIPGYINQGFNGQDGRGLSGEIGGVIGTTGAYMADKIAGKPKKD